MKTHQRAAASTLIMSVDKKTLTVQIPFSVRPHRAGKQIVTPDGNTWTRPPRVDSALVKAMVRAHRWREMLESGRHGTAADLSRAEGVTKSYLSRILRLTLLAPEIVEAVLDGKQPRELDLKVLLKPFPLTWEDQHCAILDKK
jgi:ParB-like chromosome segregation protein Spo0J